MTALAAVAAVAAVSMAMPPAGEASGVGGVEARVAGAPRVFEGLVRLPSGRRIYLECRGEGSPTVVLESGGGDGGDVWEVVEPGSRLTPVLPAVARFTRVCVYDRPGTTLASGRPSRSDPVSLPRTGADMVAELRDLLAAARVPGPYVLVGHSFGGALTRLYAGAYPRRVVGLVSVDAATEIAYERGYLELFPPEASNPPGAEFRVAPFAAELRRARVERPLQPMPMIVLEHSRDRQRVPNPFGWPPGYPIDAFERVWQAAQDDLATLLPHALHRIATRSGHYVQVIPARPGGPRHPAGRRSAASGGRAMPGRRERLSRAGEPRRRGQRQARDDQAHGQRPAARLGAPRPALPARRLRALRSAAHEGRLGVPVHA